MNNKSINYSTEFIGDFRNKKQLEEKINELRDSLLDKMNKLKGENIICASIKLKINTFNLN